MIHITAYRPVNGHINWIQCDIKTDDIERTRKELKDKHEVRNVDLTYINTTLCNT